MNQYQLELLELLARHVRFLAVMQVARSWFPRQRHARRLAVQMVRQLAKSGWLIVRDVFARPICPLTHPLCEWRHAEPIPDFVDLSRQLHLRANFPAVLTTVVSASEKTRALLFGGTATATRIKLTQTTHDLQLVEICLHYVKAEPRPGLHWVSEDALTKTWPLRERPDALLIDSDGQFVRAIEYGGDYSYERLAQLHQALASIPLAYEIW